MKDIVNKLNERFIGKEPEEVLSYFLEAYRGHIALASSLSIEDQVLTAMICRIRPETRIFTLDTGRLFPETYRAYQYDLWYKNSAFFSGL